MRGSARIPCPAPWHDVQRIERLAVRDRDAGNGCDTGRFVYVPVAAAAKGEEGGVGTYRLEHAEESVVWIDGVIVRRVGIRT